MYKIKFKWKGENSKGEFRTIVDKNLANKVLKVLMDIKDLKV